MANPELARQRRAKKPCDGAQGVGHSGLCRSTAQAGVVDPGQAEIPGDANVRDGDAGKARVPRLSRQGLAQDPLDRFLDPAAARKLPWHGTSPGLSGNGEAARSDRPGHLDAFVALDLVADLDVAVVANADAALRACADLGYVVLESAQ